MGLAGYPVFTRKANTDVSYLACARKLLSMTDRIYPQFATHNAHTVAAVLELAGADRDRFEFQRLHGMGEALHEAVRKTEGTRCRIYAPVGTHETLLAYLVRRLLENGANSSFVHQIVDKSVSPEAIARDPLAIVEEQGPAANPAIPAPAAIFEPVRGNSEGWDITDPVILAAIDTARKKFAAPHRWHAAPMTRARGGVTGDRPPLRSAAPTTSPPLDGGEEAPAATLDPLPLPHGSGGEVAREAGRSGGRPSDKITLASGATLQILNPANPNEIVGEVVEADAAQVREAVGLAVAAQPEWAARPVGERAAILLRIADLYEENAVEFFALAAREAGKTLADGVAEVREAVDFLRYYAGQAEYAETGTVARGVIACISPWNFPLAIFTGQIAAALVTGNAVIAKPAEQTPLIAARAVELMRQAGVPEDVIQLLPGDGPSVGAPLTADPRIAGVCFTGSTEVAKGIEKQLAETAAPDAMLIAETGGLNAMIVDSTALPEQVVRDVIASAFQSAGQRCSALRVLYLQDDVAPKMTKMLAGALAALNVGDPSDIETDVGPVIDDEARDSISAYNEKMEKEGRLVAKLDAPSGGRFVGPGIFRVSGIGDMEREIFGPVLHLATYEPEKIDGVIADINGKGYGLTFGLHTRIDARVQHVVDAVHAGNIYVNRNQIGAVVGSQPFGGEGLSGTGPKAGGPNYLRRFRKAAGGVAAVAGSTVTAIPASELAARFPSDAGGKWAARDDRIAVLRKLLRGKAAAAMAATAAAEYGPVDLPGPTGEANTLVTAPRGRVLCLGPDAEALLGEVVQALAAGNTVLAVAPDAAKALAPLTGKGLPLAAMDGQIDPAALADLPVDLVAFAGDAGILRKLRQALASRAGPIVGVVSEKINPMAYVHERAICVDTTAAGGNASLLAAS
jgi:RHH-type proline utilization regulon transcriptional repressor/proline dehydrogenase/delta 1-pyrroline-5-carboxylate dehydrogenase